MRVLTYQFHCCSRVYYSTIDLRFQTEEYISHICARFCSGMNSPNIANVAEIQVFLDISIAFLDILSAFLDILSLKWPKSEEVFISERGLNPALVCF